MRDLIERLEKADGPDRELDAKLARHLAGDPVDHWFRLFGDWFTDRTIPSYTSSIDAAVALVERVLPGAEWEVTNTGRRPGATVISYERRVREGAYASTPAIAICIALLRAKEARADE